MTAPRVSVVTIFFDARRWLAEAVASVLAQTLADWELLLVDDGSRDGSTELARDLAARHPGRIRHLEHPGHENRGKSTSRNLGIAEARGTYVTFLDADDVFLPDKLEQQVAILDRQADAAMVYGRTLYWFSWDDTGRDGARDFASKLGVAADTLHHPPTLLTAWLRDGGSVPCICSILARRDRVLAVGGFDETIQHLYEDQVLLAKLCLTAPIYVEGGCRERYRQHDASSSAAAIRAGAYDPFAPNPARAAFLTWLTGWLAAHPTTDPALHRALRHAWWPLRHPLLHRVATTLGRQLSVGRRYWRAARTRMLARTGAA
jgi:glycosyltransferase involved in cell wall biosynthesis